MNIPQDLLYTSDDEWVRIDGDMATVGVTDHAQDSLSDIVYLELPSAGDSFAAGETFGVVESVKAAADLYMPLSGEVIAVNEDLIDGPESVNEDPYGKAWMVQIKITDASEIDDLLDPAAYKASIEERG
ncbi:MAG: glycine cleavage system protein GcvH [Anaerolineales bacterium]|nr:glycine cleavage system protein GcvH [Anaerolineales bacterium]